VTLAIANLPAVAGKGFLVDNTGEDYQALKKDLQTAMEEVLGCGGDRIRQERLTEIENDILPMWRTMPSNAHGRLDWRSLRYVAHRYFMQQSSLLIKGLEPSRALGESEVGAAQILSQQVPEHVDIMLGGHHAEKGYSLDEAVSFLAALEQLIFDSETHLLEKVYVTQGVQQQHSIGKQQIRQLLEAYLVHWMMGTDEEGIRILLGNRTILEENFPHWDDLKGFIDGRVRSLDFERAQSPKAGFGKALMDGRYSFDDTHEVVGGITRTFQHYWESECASMKHQLVEMDRDGNGRVSLSDFYGTGMDQDWRFGESEDYLRQLGVLDETSPWRGKQVIIPNYLQAASNCIVSTSHYLVCCMNECEGLLGEIEVQIGKPTASPEQILDIVANLSSSSSQDDAPPNLDNGLAAQLRSVAESHGGQVPIHGRLFAQWLHYAFPRECPFPHKAGSFAAHTLTPTEFGQEYFATKEEMTRHADSKSATEGDEDFMTQWSAEEELFADYSGHLVAPWEHRSSGMLFSLFSLIAIGGLAAYGVLGRAKTSPFDFGSWGGVERKAVSMGLSCKPHMV
jgi:hypothetical protein